MTTTQDRDEQSGARDADAGFYDKWYRYNRLDDGAAYDRGYKSVAWRPGSQIIESLPSNGTRSTHLVPVAN